MALEEFELQELNRVRRPLQEGVREEGTGKKGTEDATRLSKGWLPGNNEGNTATHLRND